MAKPDKDDVFIGHVHVLCKAARQDKPFGLAYMPVYLQPDGKRYAIRPGKTFYRRGQGGVQHKVLPHTFIPSHG